MGPCSSRARACGVWGEVEIRPSCKKPGRVWARHGAPSRRMIRCCGVEIGGGMYFVQNADGNALLVCTLHSAACRLKMPSVGKTAPGSGLGPQPAGSPQLTPAPFRFRCSPGCAPPLVRLAACGLRIAAPLRASEAMIHDTVAIPVAWHGQRCMDPTIALSKTGVTLQACGLEVRVERKDNSQHLGRFKVGSRITSTEYTVQVQHMSRCRIESNPAAMPAKDRPCKVPRGQAMAGSN